MACQCVGGMNVQCHTLHSDTGQRYYNQAHVLDMFKNVTFNKVNKKKKKKKETQKRPKNMEAPH